MPVARDFPPPERFVFIHSHPYWNEWLKPGRLAFDENLFPRHPDDPTAVVIVHDDMDRESKGFSDVPSPGVIRTERRMVARGAKSLWLEWWDSMEGHDV